MSHHSRHPFENGKIPEELEQFFKQVPSNDPLIDMQRKLHGEYPDGRLNKEDEGAVAVMIGHENGKVVMKFGAPSSWIGFTPEQAMDIAQMLITHARKAGIVGVFTIQL